MTKKSTYKELELKKEVNMWVVVASIFFALCVIFTMFWASDVSKLETQLQECRDGIDILKYSLFECECPNLYDCVWNMGEGLVFYIDGDNCNPCCIKDCEVID